MMSSMLGLGGGVIYNPIFISFKIFPQVAFSTGMYLAIYTTLANTVLFIIANQLVVSWAIYAGVLSILGAVMGLYGVKKIMQRTGKDSILVFVLAFVILGSVLVIPIQATSDLLNKWRDGIDVFGLKSLCVK